MRILILTFNFYLTCTYLTCIVFCLSLVDVIFINLDSASFYFGLRFFVSVVFLFLIFNRWTVRMCVL